MSTSDGIQLKKKYMERVGYVSFCALNSLQGMMSWMADHPGPVYTSKAYPEWPGAVEYPLEWVCNRTREMYFNNTVAYAVAFALALGVGELHLFGLDYSYEGSEAHKRERGRACVEYWLGYAKRAGVALTVAGDSPLLDANVDKRERYYGYDAEWLTVEVDPDAGFRISRVDRAPEDIPTVDQLEVRYSHDTRLEGREKEIAT